MDGKFPGEAAFLQSILANISQEICQPLHALQGEIRQLLDDPSRPINEAEQSQAVTMLEICKDLARLTRESLGTTDSLD